MFIQIFLPVEHPLVNPSNASHAEKIPHRHISMIADIAHVQVIVSMTTLNTKIPPKKGIGGSDTRKTDYLKFKQRNLDTNGGGVDIIEEYPFNLLNRASILASY